MKALSWNLIKRHWSRDRSLTWSKGTGRTTAYLAWAVLAAGSSAENVAFVVWGAPQMADAWRLAKRIAKDLGLAVEDLPRSGLGIGPRGGKLQFVSVDLGLHSAREAIGRLTGLDRRYYDHTFAENEQLWTILQEQGLTSEFQDQLREMEAGSRQMLKEGLS